MRTLLSRRPPPVSPREIAADWLQREEMAPLSAEDRARMDAWLAADPVHRAAYEEVAYVYGVSDAHAAEPMVMSLRREALASERRSRRPAWSVAAAAAVMAVAALSWSVISVSRTAPTSSPSALTLVAEALGARADPRSAVYRTRVGERLTFNLPDGSIATLNTNSTLKVAYADGERGIKLLKGQALFEVAKRQAQPFRVYAGDRRITALGTIFDVRLDGQKVKVALVEGVVQVAPVQPPSAPTSPEQQVEMTAGEVLEADKAAPMVVATADVRRAVTWKSGIVEFAGEPLSAAVAEMNRYTDRPIRIADASVGRLQVSGVFRTGEPELFAQMVSEVVPVAVTRGQNGTTVLRKRSPDEINMTAPGTVLRGDVVAPDRGVNSPRE